MRLIRTVAAATALALGLAASPVLANAASLSQDDAAYLQTAIQTQLGRYAIGSLAQNRATNDSLKTMAKKMATQSNSDTKILSQIAKQSGVNPPSKPTLTATYHYSNISSLKGADFNKQFAKSVLIDDQEALDASQQEAKSGSDPQLKAYAQKRESDLQNEIKTIQKFTS
ncbi:MAG TPA: DUF4142 domain-containing protein [Candidatus Baltobacteraceae bacterium]